MMGVWGGGRWAFDAWARGGTGYDDAGGVLCVFGARGI